MKTHARRCAAFLSVGVISILSSTLYAETIGALLDGHDLRLEYANGTVVIVTFNADGTYRTNTGSSGKWTLHGERLCTVRDGDGVSGCGRLPKDKSRGAAWASSDADGTPITARIVPRR